MTLSGATCRATACSAPWAAAGPLPMPNASSTRPCRSVIGPPLVSSVPSRRIVQIPTVRPNEWKNGRMPSTRSAGCGPAARCFAATATGLRGLSGRCDGSTARLYARGKIVVWTPSGGPAPVQLADLAKPEFKRIAIANPEHAPYGRAAKQALEKIGVHSDGPHHDAATMFEDVYAEMPEHLREQLAEAIGVNPMTVYGWRRGRSVPGALMLAAIATALRCSFVDLLPDQAHDIGGV